MKPRAPFAWYGGKSRWADEIWAHLGQPDVYVEPFAGSLAVLLARPGGAGTREIVCDTDGGICNVWRALAADPEEVAHWADYPTIHQDLSARHVWLRNWFVENSARLVEDPEFFSAQVAGWWVWGKTLWIGSGWCDPKSISDCIPIVYTQPGGRGVSNQRLDRPDLLQWFRQLQKRLRSVIVLNRSWRSGLTKTMLWQTPSAPPGASIGVLIDPSYLGSSNLYSGNDAEKVDRTASEAYEWALENGDRFRIVYCCQAGDFVVPPGWSSFSQSFMGINKPDRLAKNRDMIMCSPACCPDQLQLFS